MRQTVAAALGLAAALTLALTACGGDAASSASSTAAAVSSTSAAVSGAPTSAAATTAEGTESPPADAPPAGGGDYSITFAVAGAPQDVTVTECVSDPMTQSFTMTGTEGLRVPLPYFPPMLYGDSQAVERLPVNGVTYPSGGPTLLFATGTHAETEDSATVSLEGEFSLPPSNSLDTKGTPFTMTFTCPVTRS